jgi:predicted nuclease with TOPRIM domain
MKDILYSIYPKILYVAIVIGLIIWIVIQRGSIAKLRLSNSAYEQSISELEARNEELRSAAAKLTSAYTSSTERMNQLYKEYTNLPKDEQIQKPTPVNINTNWKQLLLPIQPIIEGKHKPYRYNPDNR